MSTNKAEFTDVHVSLDAVNNTSTVFNPASSKGSGRVVEFKKIAANSTTVEAFYAAGTTGTWTGLVQNAIWECAIGEGETATLTLNVNMPFDGSNTGSIIGDSTFNKYFEISLNEGMPSVGMTWDVTVTINSK